MQISGVTVKKLSHSLKEKKVETTNYGVYLFTVLPVFPEGHVRS